MSGMTEIKRKKTTGEPTTNGGEFGSKQHAEADTSLATKSRRDVLNFDLKAGDVIVGDSGGRVCIEGIEPSNAMPGFMYVETEFGVLYLDAEGTSTVAAESESLVTIDINDVDPSAANRVYAAWKEQTGLTGVLYGPDDVETILIDLIEHEELEDSDGAFDKIWPVVRESEEWKRISDVDGDAWDSIRDSVRRAGNNLDTTAS